MLRQALFLLLLVLAIAAVPNCQVSGIGETCISCISGYRLHNSTSCLVEIPNCVSYNLSDCALCSLGFQLTINQCVNPLDSSNQSSPRPASGVSLPSLSTQTNISTSPSNPSSTNTPTVNYVTLPTPNPNLPSNTPPTIIREGNTNNQNLTPTPSQTNASNGSIQSSSDYMFARQLPSDIASLPSYLISQPTQPVLPTIISTSTLQPQTAQTQNYFVPPPSQQVTPQSITTAPQLPQILPTFPIQQPSTDPHCAAYSSSGSCLQCSQRYYFGQNRVCTPVSNNCNGYDAISGVCTSCYQSFTLYNGQCYVSLSQTSVNDPNCRVSAYNGCQQCYQGYIIINGVCSIGNTFCRTTDYQGRCTSCYNGYTLIGGNCSVSITPSQINNCANTVNGVCTQCSQGYYFANNNCVQSNPLCQSINSYGNCVSCYNGYTLQQGNCVITPSDMNCASFMSGVCNRCSKGFYMANGICTMVSPLCSTYNETYGYCTSCYTGYSLINGQCNITQQSNMNVNCRNFSNGICYECSNRYYNLNGLCTAVNDYCNGYNPSNGGCTSCYQGYVLQGGSCYKILVMNSSTPAQNNLDWASVQQEQLRQLSEIANQQALMNQQVQQQQLAQQAQIVAQQQSQLQAQQQIQTQPQTNFQQIPSQPQPQLPPQLPQLPPQILPTAQPSVQSPPSTDQRYYPVYINYNPCIRYDAFGNCLQCSSGFSVSGIGCTVNR